MPAHDDFNDSLEHAAGLTMDATCVLRAAGARCLPHPHKRLLTSTIRSLERAQSSLHTLRNDPWEQPKPKPKQLTLL